MSDDLKLYLARVGRTLGEKPDSVETILGRVRAIIGPANMPSGEQGQLAQAALDAMRQMKRPTAQQLAALEYVIRLMRPAPLSRQGKLDNLGQDFTEIFSDWNAFQKSVKPFLYSVGRIDSLAKRSGVGTGFLVTPKMIATNRHVLDALSNGTNMLEKGQAVVRFGQEYSTPDSLGEIHITSVVAVHESLDIALLELEKSNAANARTPVVIEENPVSAGEAVAAIGYPFDDPVRNPMFVKALFGGKFGVKRAAPGEVLKTSEQAVYHDCSTLNGNSGSPIFSMKTARVVGIHRDSFFMYRNEAVDGASLNKFVNQHV